MTKYYTFKPDFEKGKNTGWGHSNIECVKDLLDDIDDVSKVVNSEGLAHLYVATGEATLGRDMPVNTFEDAEHHALNRLEASKKVHKEIMQNIDGKFFEGLDDALDSLNKVNEGKNQYKSEHLTYEKDNVSYDEYGNATHYKTTEHYSISDIVNSDKTPIPAAKELYDAKLKLAKEGLGKLEKENREQYDKLKGLSDQELMEAMFPTQLGEYERARSTWKENNKGWLKWVEIGGKIVAVGAIIAGSILSGGTLAPVLIGAGTAYLVADSSYQAISGETISGTRLSDEDRAWAAADAVLTAATGGLATYASVLAKTGKVASTTVQTATKVANYADDANDIAHTIRTAQDDPLGAALQFGVGRAIGHGATALGNKARARIGNGGGTGDVDLPTGGKKGVEVPTGSSPRLKATEAPDIDASGLGKGKNVKPEVSASNRSGVDAPSSNNRSADVDVTKNPKFDSSNRPTIDKTNTKAGDIDTGKPVKPEVSASNRSGVDVPSNNRPADVDVTKKPEVSSSRPTEVTKPKTEAEVPSKVNPDLDDAAGAAGAIPRVKAQEPDLPKAGQPETSPSEPSKKVQKPEEVDTEVGTTKPRYGERRISDAEYESLRRKTPSPEMRKKVNKDVVLPMDDPAIPGHTIEKGETLEADHIVSMDRITKMEGFDKLTEKQQLEILNYEDNFIGLSKPANASKGSKTYEEWTTYVKEGISINPEFREKMIAREKELEGIIQNMIDSFVKGNGG